MRILVTGARGKVGAATVDAVHARGPPRHRLGPDRAGLRGPGPGGARYLEADLTDAGARRARPRPRRGHPRRRAPGPVHHPPHVVFRNNLMGTFNVVEAAVRSAWGASSRLERDGRPAASSPSARSGRLRAGRRGAPGPPAGPLRLAKRFGESCGRAVARSDVRRCRSARAGCSGRGTSSATSGPSCAPAARTRPCLLDLGRRRRPRRGAAARRRERAPRPRGLLHRSPDNATGLPLHDLVRRHHGDAVALRAVDRPDASGISTAKARRLLGWRPTRERRDLLDDDGRLTAAARDRLERGDTAVQRGRAATA